MENQDKSKFNDHLVERTIQMGIVVEECDETLFWIEYLIRINLLVVAKTKEICSQGVKNVKCEM